MTEGLRTKTWPLVGSQVTSGRLGTSSTWLPSGEHWNPAASCCSAATPSEYCFGRVAGESVSAAIIWSSDSLVQSTADTAFSAFARAASSSGCPVAPWACAQTSRKRSWAVLPTWSTMLPRRSPGISMMTWLPPWVVTSASDTPVALTRWSMMSRASRSFSGVTSPDEASACRVMRVPPWRSRPRRGFQTAPSSCFRSTPTSRP